MVQYQRGFFKIEEEEFVIDRALIFMSSMPRGFISMESISGCVCLSVAVQAIGVCSTEQFNKLFPKHRDMMIRGSTLYFISDNSIKASDVSFRFYDQSCQDMICNVCKDRFRIFNCRSIVVIQQHLPYENAMMNRGGMYLTSPPPQIKNCFIFVEKEEPQDSFFGDEDDDFLIMFSRRTEPIVGSLSVY